MNSIELLNRMLSLYFEPDPDGCFLEGIRYIGNMPTLIQGFVDIEIIINDKQVQTKLFLNQEVLKNLYSECTLKQEYRGDYPLIAEFVARWEEFNFSQLLQQIAQQNHFE